VGGKKGGEKNRKLLGGIVNLIYTSLLLWSGGRDLSLSVAESLESLEQFLRLVLMVQGAGHAGSTARHAPVRGGGGGARGRHRLATLSVSQLR